MFLPTSVIKNHDKAPVSIAHLKWSFAGGYVLFTLFPSDIDSLRALDNLPVLFHPAHINKIMRRIITVTACSLVLTNCATLITNLTSYSKYNRINGH